MRERLCNVIKFLKCRHILAFHACPCRALMLLHQACSTCPCPSPLPCLCPIMGFCKNRDATSPSFQEPSPPTFPDGCQACRCNRCLSPMPAHRWTDMQGFGYVKFSHSASAMAAVEQLNGLEFPPASGHYLKVCKLSAPHPIMQAPQSQMQDCTTGPHPLSNAIYMSILCLSGWCRSISRRRRTAHEH